MAAIAQLERVGSDVTKVADQFALNGFAVVNDLADAECVEELRKGYDGILDGTIPCPTKDHMLGGVTRQVQNPHRYHSVFRSNAAVERAKAHASAILGCDNPEIIFSMMIYKPGGHPVETPWHVDLSYTKMPTLWAGASVPNNLNITFWLALDDVDETMGCMEFIPGKQNDPMLEHVVASGDPTAEGRLLAIRDPATALDLSTAVKCPLRAGSATVHGYATPHFTGPNTSTRQRRAYIFSFARPDIAEVMTELLVAGPPAN